MAASSTSRVGPHACEGISERKKVLIVVDSFPSTGGTRIDKFVKLLPEFNVDPIVLSAAENDTLSARNIKENTYPVNLKTYYGKSIGWAPFTKRYLVRGEGSDRYRLFGLLSYPERFCMMPDHMIRWIPHGKRLARTIVSNEGISTVLTSSPSESVHLIGLYLKQKLGIRWVADFRDLWTDKKLLYRPATTLHDRWIRKLERTIFNSADHIVANTPENADRHFQQFHLPRERISVIPNGFDRDDFPEHVQKPFGSPESMRFRIGYAGSIDKHDFPWRLALQALKKLADHVGRNRVRFIQCGYASDAFKSYIESEKIEDLVEIHGVLSHRDAMKLVAETEIRLLLLYDNAYSDAIVPLKLYNYLVMNGPILAIASEKGRTAKIISDTRTGVVISEKHGVDGVFAELSKYFEQWENGTIDYLPDLQQIAVYDRRVQSKKLAEVL